MKTTEYHKVPLLYFALNIIITGWIPSASADSDLIQNIEISIAAKEATSIHKALSVNNSASVTITTSNRKTQLLEEPRDLSAFFILGIVINIIMATAFAWWFSREWRKSKK